jgi:hypothetical protein
MKKELEQLDGDKKKETSGEPRHLHFVVDDISKLTSAKLLQRN